MAQVPEGAKKPTDRKTKDEAPAAAFTFTDDEGNEHTLADTAEKITPGFMRKHRESSAQAVLYDALELVADEAALDVLDNMSWKRNAKVLQEFDDYLSAFFGASLGE